MAAAAVKYELKYFNLRGRGEQIRLLFAYAKVPYTDTGIEFKDWPAVKPTLPFGQLPVLIETKGADTHVIPQSQAILRHLGRTLNLYGKNESEMTQADIVADSILDFRATWGPAAGAPGRWLADQKAVDEFFDQKMPGIAKTMEKFVNAHGFLVSDAPTFADFAGFELFDNLTTVRPQCLKDTPKVTGWLDKIRSLDGVKEYLTKRRPSVFFPK